MPSFGSESDRLSQRIIERWKIFAQHELNDIEGWRYNALEKGWYEPWLTEQELASFWADTTYLASWIVTKYPLVDPKPLSAFYEIVAAWEHDRDVDRLPNRIIVEEKSLAAVAILLACEMGIESRSVPSRPTEQPVARSPELTRQMSLNEIATAIGGDPRTIKARLNDSLTSNGKQWWTVDCSIVPNNADAQLLRKYLKTNPTRPKGKTRSKPPGAAPSRRAK